MRIGVWTMLSLSRNTLITARAGTVTVAGGDGVAGGAGRGNVFRASSVLIPIFGAGRRHSFRQELRLQAAPTG